MYDVEFLEWLSNDQELFFTGEYGDQDAAWILDYETDELWHLYQLSSPGTIRAASLSPSGKYFYAQQSDQLVVVELPERVRETQ